ncbi:hypothetical protein ACROYT_G000547 [Oculina patagonica]
MSLVAYTSSDEESDEEVQNSQENVEKPALTEEAKDPAKGKGLVLPSPKRTSELSISSGRKTTLSSFLPKPKNANNIEKERTSEQAIPKDKAPISLETMLEDEEILEIEEEYEPISKRAKKVTNSGEDDKPKSVGSLFSLLSAPWQAENTWQKKKDSKMSTAEEKRSKQPIKIAIPTAPKNDSDEEDDMPAAKKVVPSKGGSGLKALLPKPKHSITLKKDNPNKPAVKLASRPLIPHTLTKKPTTVEKKSQKTAKTKQVEEATSDDEDEPVSFFTFNDKSESVSDEKVETFQSNNTESNTSVTAPSVKSINPSVSPFSQGEMPSCTSASHSSGKPLTVAPSPKIEDPSTTQAAFEEETPSREESETRTYHYEQQSGQSQQYGSYSSENYGNYDYGASSSYVNQPYYSQETEAYTYTYPTGAAAAEATAVQAQRQHEETKIDLEKLHKLKGRRNRHEEINIVDVNAADQIGDSAGMIAKYGTEEIAYAPSRKKKDMPTAQQRRKHQISYLAFQAKERELELRQQWSANRQTRRQTQSKYGF